MHCGGDAVPVIEITMFHRGNTPATHAMSVAMLVKDVSVLQLPKESQISCAGGQGHAYTEPRTLPSTSCMPCARNKM
jgi:hypothetical protein